MRAGVRVAGVSEALPTRGNKGRVYPHAELSFPWRGRHAQDVRAPHLDVQKDKTA